MLKEKESPLERERKSLITQWIDAKESDKPRLIVRIMDIEDQIEVEKQQKTRQIG